MQVGGQFIQLIEQGGFGHGLIVAASKAFSGDV